MLNFDDNFSKTRRDSFGEQQVGNFAQNRHPVSLTIQKVVFVEKLPSWRRLRRVESK